MVKAPRVQEKMIYPALGILSIALIAFQVALIQIFSITQWYHFAYMVISIALLGFGMASTFLSLFEKWILDRFDLIFPLSMILTGLFMSTVVMITNLGVFRFDTYLLFSDYRQIMKLISTYLLLILPFFCGALVIGVAFVKYVEKINNLYFYNLIGSGLGGIFFLAMVWWALPSQLPGVIALLPLIFGATLLKRNSPNFLKGITIASIALTCFQVIRPPTLISSEFKSISRTMLMPETEIIGERNSPYGLLQILHSPHLRYAPGVSLNYQGEIFPMDVVFTNGNWTGPLVPFETMSTDSLFHSSTLALPYEIRRPASVLVLQSHTGEALVHALENRVSKITGVEGNKTLVDMLKRELAGQTDSLLYRSEVNVIPLEARTYLSTDTTQADLIVLPVINVFGGASGISAIQEQYLFTKESFTNIWMRLSSSGMLTATTWIDHPSRDPLRLTNTMVELLEDQGIENAEQHLIAIKSWSTITFVLSKNRFADEEIASVRAFCRAESFDPVILLDMKVEERDAYHELEDSFFYQYIDSILSNGRQNFYDTYDFKIAPTTDDQPYFSQHLRLKSLPYLKSDLGLRPALFLELGYLLVLATFFQILILALILIVLPLSKLSFPRSNLAWTIFYFSGLGIGYMFVEIVFIQQFILYLGNAIYAATAVLSCLLLSSGLGSYYANRLIRKPGELIWCTAAILILLLLYSLIFTSSLQSTIGTDLPIKIGILILLTFPLGFLMGIPFPSGIALMSGRGSGSIPWAWGINGYFSVISTVLAMIISIEFGFSVLLILAAVAYALPMLAQLLLTPSP